ncbi:MAG: hypothetical protein Q6366_009740 [Candidatus Freyarchaeota archaeon]
MENARREILELRILLGLSRDLKIEREFSAYFWVEEIRSEL